MARLGNSMARKFLHTDLTFLVFATVFKNISVLNHRRLHNINCNVKIKLRVYSLHCYQNCWALPRGGKKKIFFSLQEFDICEVNFVLLACSKAES